MSENMSHELNEQEIVRREKMEALREKGIDPFGVPFKPEVHSKDLFDQYDGKTKEELETLDVATKVAGRVMTKRVMGKAGFMHIQDLEGQIQIYVRKNDVGDEVFEYFQNLDLGDIVGVTGTVFKTNKDELSVYADTLVHLTKALRPLPDKYHGLVGTEERYRRRYVDLIMSQKSKDTARKRSLFMRKLREFLDNEGMIEVETPVLTPILGGAAARPFVTHHNTLDMDFYLRIATELPLKRLIVGGMERVYEIGRLFRNEGISAKHNPEFTTVEAYQAFGDVTDMMKLVEDCLSSVAFEVNGSYDVVFNDQTIHLKDFKRAHMVDLIKEQTGEDFFNHYSLDEAKQIAKKHNVQVEPHFTVGHIIEAFFNDYVEKTIIQPTIVFGHPVEISPLAKSNDKDPRFTDRFELFIMGSEYANAFSELNDPVDQKNRDRKSTRL